MSELLQKLLVSWGNQGQAVHETDALLEWIERRNAELTVHITPNRLSESGFWYYDEAEGCVTNRNKSFFSICGLNARLDGEAVEQPVILQDEIGYLGILCKEIKGCLHFLMQAKIEPGNVNLVQISPTIQATKSNFTQQHGGSKPPYLDYFTRAKPNQIIVDQIQSEQSSRFFKKRNRNIVVLIQGEIEVLPSHRWMTLGQIKRLMRYDNLVNMDTRTVLSCIPYALLSFSSEDTERYFRDKSFYRSILRPGKDSGIPAIYHEINNQKMFELSQAQLVRLDELRNWRMDDQGITCNTPYSFSVIYCDIEVEGREVRRWTQPLMKANGIATFGLYTTVLDGIRKFLVHVMPEVGCFDGAELGPTVQREPVCDKELDTIEQHFFAQWKRRENVIYQVILSEEGGRFYHEQNQNLILEVDFRELTLPKGYFWLDYHTLNLLTQVNNCLNIQLRNLLSLLEA